MSIFEKKYQIFISSTYNDLINAREELIKLFLSLYQIPIGMEMFSADNEEQWQTIKKTIEDSDYYLWDVYPFYTKLINLKLYNTSLQF